MTDERSAIVAWLRDCAEEAEAQIAPGMRRNSFEWVALKGAANDARAWAAAIERGAHLVTEDQP